METLYVFGYETDYNNMIDNTQSKDNVMQCSWGEGVFEVVGLVNWSNKGWTCLTIKYKTKTKLI